MVFFGDAVIVPACVAQMNKFNRNPLHGLISNYPLSSHHPLVNMIRKAIVTVPRALASRLLSSTIRPTPFLAPRIAISPSAASRRSYHEKDKALFSPRVFSLADIDSSLHSSTTTLPPVMLGPCRKRTQT